MQPAPSRVVYPEVSKHSVCNRPIFNWLDAAIKCTSSREKRYCYLIFLLAQKQLLRFRLWRSSNPKGEVPAKSNAILKSPLPG